MSLLNTTRMAIVGAATALLVTIGTAGAQDITDSHLKAARTAVNALGATNDFDGILPSAAIALKDQLIQQNPDMQALIEKTVDEKALAMASRRSDLEKEVATAYAKLFSEQDLNAISAFYSSEAGKNLIKNGPLVIQQVRQAADIWQRGIARDLATQVATDLAAAANANAPKQPADGAAPAGGTAPAADAQPAKP